MSDWHIADEDCLLCYKPIPATNPERYEFIQLNSYSGNVEGRAFHQISHGTIHIHNDYSEKDLTSILNAFGYPDMNAFVKEIAELDNESRNMIFEILKALTSEYGRVVKNQFMK